LDPQVLAEIQGLALRTRHVVDGFLAGTHRNIDPGTSTEYSQHRPYVPGDDLRHVDWKAYGRTDRIYVKQFLDETNLACTFLLDSSSSMAYRGQRAALSKMDYASCLIASLAWLLRQQGDAVGVSVCCGTARLDIPAAASDHQLANMIQGLESIQAKGKSDLGQELKEWGIRTERRQLVVVVSDFFCQPTTLHKTLTDLRQFGHDVVLFQVCDPDEVEFPFDRFAEFRGLESGQPLAVDAASIRASYLHKFEHFQQQLQALCHRTSIDFKPLVTQQSLGVALGHFLTRRNQPESGL